MREDELTTISSREVGARMRRVREQRGISATDLSASVGVTEEQLRAWEGGQGVPPYETMQAIAAALSTTAEAFVS